MYKVKICEYTSPHGQIAHIYSGIVKFAPLKMSEEKTGKVNTENKPRGLYFSKALFEGLIFGGAYLRREICVSKSIRLTL